MTDSTVRRRRARAAAKYRPDHVKLLLVAEAPPAAEDRYFYFENVRDQDSLFRYVVKTVLMVEPSRADKPAQLAALRDAGVFLIDLKVDPKTGDEDLASHVPSLVRRAVKLQPAAVIAIKANVCTLCQQPLRDAGLTVGSPRVPFPGSGQQARFEAAMADALAEVGWI